MPSNSKLKLTYMHTLDSQSFIGIGAVWALPWALPPGVGIPVGRRTSFEHAPTDKKSNSRPHRIFTLCDLELGVGRPLLERRPASPRDGADDGQGALWMGGEDMEGPESSRQTQSATTLQRPGL